MDDKNYGSTYNPTGDPLFYMPYWMRITEMIAGNAEGMRDTTNRHRPTKELVVMSDEGEVRRIDSIDKAAEEYKLTRTGIYHRLTRGNKNADGTWFEYAKGEE